MGRSTLFLVLAAIVGGSYLSYNVLRTQTETTSRRANAQSNVLARQLAESGQAIALSSITQLDGFANNGVFSSDREYNGGTILFEDYEDGLPATSPQGERVAIQVSGQYGGAMHRLSSVYEFDPMDFPGPLWIDVPYASASIAPGASFSGGAFGYEPQIDPTKYQEYGISSLGLSLDGAKSAINATGSTVPSWDTPGTDNDGLGRTADLGEGVSSADDLYYQLANAVEPAEGDMVITVPHTVSGAETYGTPETITQFLRGVTVPAGSKLEGTGALIVEGDLIVEGKMDWRGLVIVRSTEQSLQVALKNTTIKGAFVISQEALPPGGHMDMTVFRQPGGVWTQPYGRRAAGPGALSQAREPWASSGAWPFWQHVHKFDYPQPGAADFAARTDRGVRLVDDSRGDPQETYSGMREMLDYLGSDKVYVEFDNVDKHGHAMVQMEVDGEDAFHHGLAMGFAGTDLEGSAKHRSKAFQADDLEQLIIQPQTLRSLRKLWDQNGVCAGAYPAQWPVCVGYDQNDRQGALTVRLRRADNDRVLYEMALYWHMQAGQEHQDYQADVAAWQATINSGTTPFGTTFSMSANSSMTYDLVPIVALAEKAGFDGNQVVHVSTESRLIEADRLGGVDANGNNGGTNNGGTTNNNNGGTNNGGGKGGGNSSDDDDDSDELACPDPLLPTAFCNKAGGWKDEVRSCADVQTHLDHGCLLGTCASNGLVPGAGGDPSSGLLGRIVGTVSQAIPSNSNERVKVCRPDGGNPNASWNEEEMRFKEVGAYLAAHPLALYGTCSDHNR